MANDINWTKDQQSAIDSSGGSVVVSAAAGSGKTAVLVQRVLRLLETVEVDRLLIVTFTKAAAAQMRAGITEAILSRLQTETERERIAHFSRQLSLLSEANITTMHAFCLELIRNYFEKLDLAPDFGIAEEAQQVLLLQEALRSVFDTLYEQKDADFLAFVDNYASMADDEKVLDMVRRAYHFVRSVPYPEKWLVMAEETYALDDVDKAPWMGYRLMEIKQALAELYAMQESALAYIAETPEVQFARDLFVEDGKIVDAFMESCHSYKTAYAFAKQLTLPKFEKPKGSSKDPAIMELDARRKAFGKRLDHIIKTDLCYAPSDFLRLFAMQKAHVHTLCRLVTLTGEKYSALKKEKNVVDFNDLEHFAIFLLTNEDGSPSALAKELSEEFEEIIVDEYQDTNDVQETVLGALSKDGHNLFMVGDMKQSIYSFRHTAPELFLEKINKFSDEGNENGKRIFLSSNFRSRKTVLDFANFLFSQLMNPVVGGVTYTDKEKLHYGAAYPEAPEATELYLLEDPRTDAKERITQEALFIASKIRQMMDDGFSVLDKKSKQMRPVRFGDFAILARDLKNYSDVLCAKLESCGIPVFCDNNRDAFLDAVEISTLIAYLKIIDNPLQDIPLAASLRGPLGGFSDEELAKIRLCGGKDVLFYDCLVHYAEQDEKAAAFLRTLEIWRARAVYLSVSELIDRLLTETGYLDYAASLPGGGQRRINILFLTESARSFEKSGVKGLFRFLRYLDQFPPKSGGMSAPKALPETMDAVQVTTIHKSKGLEYPVVFLPRLEHTFNQMDARSALLMHKTVGFGFDHQDRTARIKTPSPVKTGIKAILRSEQLSEEMRILYVALTRAKEKTILIGTVKDMDKKMDGLRGIGLAAEEEIPFYHTMRCKSYLDWILLALLRHPVMRELRKTYEISAHEIAGGGNITLEYPTQVILPEEAQQTQMETVSEETPAFAEKILSYRYPYQADSEMFQKVSVTELKKLLAEDQDAHRYFDRELTPIYDVETGTSPTSRGTAVHLVMEKLDFSETHGKEDVFELVQTMLGNDLLTDEEAKVIPIDQIAAFLESDIGKRLQTADRIYRETPFNIAIQSDVFYPDRPPVSVQMQGVIDCYFEENGTFIILDYKTDRITPQNREWKISEYAKQVAFYEMAVSRMHGGAPTKGYLYFFDQNLLVETTK